MPNTRRILIVDDDADFTQIVAEGLQDRGHTCRAVCDPELLSTADWLWAEVVITDLELGGERDGPQILRRMRLVRSHPTILMVSGHDPTVLAAASRSAEDLGYVVAAAMSKPLSIVALAKAVTLAEAPSPARPLNAPGPIDLEDLREGLANGEIRVVFQPKVSLADGACAGFEVLARWTSPRLGDVAPDRFIPVAETSEAIFPLTQTVFDQGLGMLARWRDESLFTSLAFNVSGRVMASDGLVEWLRVMIARHGVTPQQVILELTETAAEPMRGKALENAARLRLAGFGLSLDDFGAGENRFERLLGLPLTEVKLDKRFAQLIGKPHGRRVIDGVLALTRSLGMRCVAEGVEDQATQEAFASSGCEMGQGWRFSPPLSAADCVAFMQTAPYGRTKSNVYQ